MQIEPSVVYDGIRRRRMWLPKQPPPVNPQFVVVAFGGVLLTILYLWKRDLPACMIAHAVTDLVGFALARAHS